MSSFIAGQLWCQATSQAFRFPICVPLDSGTQPGQSPRTTNSSALLLLQVRSQSYHWGTCRAMTFTYCAPDVSLVSFGRQYRAALKPLLCSAKLDQPTTHLCQRGLAQSKHLFMRLTDDRCEEIPPSHAVQHIMENAPKIQSLPVGRVTNLYTPPDHL